MKSYSVNIQMKPLKQYFYTEEEDGKMFVSNKRDLMITCVITVFWYLHIDQFIGR